ncbi:hypothetical protein Ddye_023065 [Dipteronia dyeriana]|uniref:Uncharacterized protein n=1 Tax=Dipteronia dyeriana TaxID=168575 RepID=A0AAD9TS99_9ROSI|nr:hypothetical protein Ddye_023065 [Dipteronia dyeriana]
MDSETQQYLFCHIMRAVELKDTTEVELLENLLQGRVPNQLVFLSVDVFYFHSHILHTSPSSTRRETGPTMVRTKLTGAHQKTRASKVLALPRDVKISRQTIDELDVETEHSVA